MGVCSLFLVCNPMKNNPSPPPLRRPFSTLSAIFPGIPSIFHSSMQPFRHQLLTYTYDRWELTFPTTFTLPFPISVLVVVKSVFSVVVIMTLQIPFTKVNNLCSLIMCPLRNSIIPLELIFPGIKKGLCLVCLVFYIPTESFCPLQRFVCPSAL